MHLTKGEVYVKTLLKRAGGCPLDIVSCPDTAFGVMSLLPPYIQQIRSLSFNCRNIWANVRKFSDLNPGPLPLLRTLEIDEIEEVDPFSPNRIIPHLIPFFSNTANLQEFRLHSPRWLPLNHFTFPNLAFFELSVLVGGLRVPQLLDFLEASPVLQKVDMKIYGDIFYDGVARERVSVLHNVKSFCLAVNDERGYKLATHISCPSAKHTSFTHKHEQDSNGPIPREIFPASVSWNTIIQQYTTSPVEEVALEMVSLWSTLECSLTFWSPNASVMRLRFEFEDKEGDQGELETFFVEMHCEVFSQASRTIRDLALLTDIKRLHVHHVGPVFVGETQPVMPIANEVGRLFKSVGPLEELIFRSSQTERYFDSLFSNPESLYTKHPIVSPPIPIKELTVSHPIYESDESFMAAIVGLVKSQHALGVPFERVTVRMHHLPTDMEEKLRPWVGAAHCYKEPNKGGRSVPW